LNLNIKRGEKINPKKNKIINKHKNETKKIKFGMMISSITNKERRITNQSIIFLKQINPLFKN